MARKASINNGSPWSAFKQRKTLAEFTNFNKEREQTPGAAGCTPNEKDPRHAQALTRAAAQESRKRAGALQKRNRSTAPHAH